MLTAKIIIGKVFSPHNRGLLLDGFIFLLNLILLRTATGIFIGLTKAEESDYAAHLAVTLFITGILFLSPLGAILKRRQFWQRIEVQNKTAEIEENAEIFIFSPKICFAWTLILSLLAGILWCSLVLENYLSWGAMFLGVFFGAPSISLLNAYLISTCFKRPAKEARLKFLETPLSASLGDLCLFLNLICFQIFWGLLNKDPWRESVGAFEIIESLIAFCLMMLLFYFPARSFYLIEDIKRPAVWGMIFLANLPSFLFVVFGIRFF